MEGPSSALACIFLGTLSLQLGTVPVVFQLPHKFPNFCEHVGLLICQLFNDPASLFIWVIKALEGVLPAGSLVPSSFLNGMLNPLYERRNILWQHAKRCRFSKGILQGTQTSCEDCLL